jgi:diaminohydroxyphosphoribosylaminopyrimidine deaminase/5-amino-6-(5-phosphoribosylamino)uracil reductase
MRAQDEKYIAATLGLAKRAEGLTSPNPCVGAVVVKGGRIIGKGYHKRAGGPHAEVLALRQAGRKAKGATLYISLEPCCHYGRTPPCVDSIASAGIKRVVAAMKDPNPLNNGKGIAALKRYGIRTDVGILEDKARRLNEAFIKYITKKMPFVTVKVAQSLDGKIATWTGDSKWISGEESRRFVHRLRAKVGAIIVGARTVLKDDPLLTARIKGRGVKQPLTASLIESKRKPLMAGFNKQPLRVILCGDSKIPSSARVLKSKGGEVIIAKARKDGRVDIKALLKDLARRGVTHVLIEGGGEVIASALEAKAVDKVCFFISPKIIGGRQAVTSVEGLGAGKVSKAVYIRNATVRKLGGDFMIEGYVRN